MQVCCALPERGWWCIGDKRAMEVPQSRPCLIPVLCQASGCVRRVMRGVHQAQDMRVRAGVLDATEETRISQVRAAALETLAALLDATGGGRSWPSELQARVRGRLQDAVASEKASVIRAQAAAVLKLVAGQSSDASWEARAAAGSLPPA